MGGEIKISNAKTKNKKKTAAGTTVDADGRGVLNDFNWCAHVTNPTNDTVSGSAVHVCLKFLDSQIAGDNKLAPVVVPAINDFKQNLASPLSRFLGAQIVYNKTLRRI